MGAPSTPSQPPPRGPQRPWYLMIALIIAWVFGATAFVDGFRIVLYYQDPSVDVEGSRGPIASIDHDDHRADAAKAAEQLLSVMDKAKNRVFPLSVAEMLLGAAMVAFAARAMSGRAGARTTLVQVVGVQAALVIAAHVLTADVRAASTAADMAVFSGQLRDKIRDSPSFKELVPDPETFEKTMATAPKWRVFQEHFWVAGRTLLSAFIILALTRARSRAFFEAANERFSER